MAKLFGLMMIILGIWAGVEIYTEGTRDAFGGALAPWLAQEEAAAHGRSVVQRAGEAVTDAYQQDEERRDNLLAQVDEGAATGD